MVFSVVLLGALLSQATPPARSTAADTQLIEAAKIGDLTRVRELLAKGAAPDTSDRRGLTPLIWASASGHAGIGPAAARKRRLRRPARQRRNHGADAGLGEWIHGSRAHPAGAGRQRRGHQRKRRCASARAGAAHADVAALLEQAQALGTRLLQAATEGHDMVVRQLLASGAPVNVTDERGTTALMIAARNGDLGMLQALLSRGADRSVRDSQGRTAFDWAEPSPDHREVRRVVSARPRRFETGSSRERANAVAAGQSHAFSTLATVLARVPPASDSVRNGPAPREYGAGAASSASANWPAESPDDYRDNLAGAVAALEAALKAGEVRRSGRNGAGRRRRSRDQARTLHEERRKIGRVGHRSGADAAGGRREQELAGVLHAEECSRPPSNATPDLFPQLSSPTEEALVPGRYVMWVRDPATARLGERTVVKVGEGRKELLLELPVPAAHRDDERRPSARAPQGGVARDRAQSLSPGSPPPQRLYRRTRRHRNARVHVCGTGVRRDRGVRRAALHRVAGEARPIWPTSLSLALALGLARSSAADMPSVHARRATARNRSSSARR